MSDDIDIDQFREQAAACIERIQAEDYYVSRWELVKHRRPLDQIDSIEELLLPFQAMWEALPDSGSMRWGPFFDICRLAEHYCFGDWRGAA